MERGYPRVTVSKKCERFIKSGHVWVYHDEILTVDGNYENGDIVDVLTEKGSSPRTPTINSTRRFTADVSITRSIIA